MRELWTRLGSGGAVLGWSAWLTLVFAIVIFAPAGVARWFGYSLLVSWGLTALFAYAAGSKFEKALRQHAPDVAEQIGSIHNFWWGRFAARKLASLALLKAVRADPDLGPSARAYAVAYWYPLLLFIVAIPGFAYMSQR